MSRKSRYQKNSDAAPSLLACLSWCGRREHFFLGPSAVDSVLESLHPDAGLAGPGREAQRAPPVGDISVARNILALLETARPSAVIRAVVPVAVDALNRELRVRGLAHVGKKLIEIQPFRADSYPSASVSRVGGSVRILAPLAHAVPARVKRLSSMPLVPAKFAPKTAARLHVAAEQMLGRYILGGAAIALAQPCFWGVDGDNNESGKAFSNHGHVFTLMQDEFPVKNCGARR